MSQTRIEQMSEHLATMKLHIRYINEYIRGIEGELELGVCDFTPACVAHIKERTTQIRLELLELKIAGNITP
jgi:hypothetical protein